jgi:hypothetical protein
MGFKDPPSQEYQPAVPAAGDQQGMPGGIYGFQDRAKMITDPSGTSVLPPVGHPRLQTIRVKAPRTQPRPQIRPRMRLAQSGLKIRSPDQEHAGLVSAGDFQRKPMFSDLPQQPDPNRSYIGCAQSARYQDPCPWFIHAQGVGGG